MQRFPRPFGGRPLRVFALAILLGVGLGAGCLRAGEAQQNLQLDVSINNAPANMIGSFVLFADGRIGATQNELAELGLRVDAKRDPNETIRLDDIPSLKYEYLERSQKILITVDNAHRLGRTFDLRRDSGSVRAQAGWGAVLNYDLFSTTSNVHSLQMPSFGGTSLTLEGRAFSPFGTLEQSAIAVSAPDQSAEIIRLDSSFRYSDAERMTTYRAGDAINGGLSWSRPIRIGGFQVQSNFALRPDLITMPLPTLGGTAGVPSTVDLYVNNIKTFSQNVGAGPFNFSNVPIISGAGNAQIVIRDSSGHETKSTVPFYASSSLLAPGLTSWSLEAGFPRLSYGSPTDTYTSSPIASGTLRRGLFDWLTVEGHAEGGNGVLNGGAGVAVNTGNIGVATAAVAASGTSLGNGFQTYLSYETQLFGFNIYTSSQRAFGTYDDLASATARLQDYSGAAGSFYSIFNHLPTIALNPQQASAAYQSARPPRAVDRITIGVPLPFDTRSNLSTSFIHLKDASGNLSEILTASYSRSLPYNATIFGTVFRDFGTNKNTGFFVGLTFPLRDSASVSSGVSSGAGGNTASIDAVKPLGTAPGSVGWRVHDSEGASPYREASVSYRSNYGTVEAGASQDRYDSHGTLELRGSIATMGGGVFFSNWIDDAFVVVNAGAPGVEVSHDNRPIGTTDAKGLLLVPTLRSFQKNKITVDPANLPVDVEIEGTREIVAPADRAGVLVNFNVRSDTSAAVAVFVLADGSFVPAGAAGRIERGKEFIVGYDGRAFIRDLRASNKATIEFLDKVCRANFDFVPRPGKQVLISPVRCE